MAVGSSHAERRLAAIMAVDMAGYSRLIELAEADVLGRQKRYRRELIDPTLERFGGAIVKTTGDGLIAAFSSVQDAVRAALAIQEAMQEREGAADEARRILYRIGINLGDVVFEERLFDMAATMIRQGWGAPHRAYRRFFTETLMPDATPD